MCCTRTQATSSSTSSSRRPSSWTSSPRPSSSRTSSSASPPRRRPAAPARRPCCRVLERADRLLLDLRRERVVHSLHHDRCAVLGEPDERLRGTHTRRRPTSQHVRTRSLEERPERAFDDRPTPRGGPVQPVELAGDPGGGLGDVLVTDRSDEGGDGGRGALDLGTPLVEHEEHLGRAAVRQGLEADRFGPATSHHEPGIGRRQPGDHRRDRRDRPHESFVRSESHPLLLVETDSDRDLLHHAAHLSFRSTQARPTPRSDGSRRQVAEQRTPRQRPGTMAGRSGRLCVTAARRPAMVEMGGIEPPSIAAIRRLLRAYPDDAFCSAPSFATGI